MARDVNGSRRVTLGCLRREKSSGRKPGDRYYLVSAKATAPAPPAMRFMKHAELRLIQRLEVMVTKLFLSHSNCI